MARKTSKMERLLSIMYIGVCRAGSEITEYNEEVAQHNEDIQEIKQHEEEILELPGTGEPQQHKLSHPRIIFLVHEVPTKRNIDFYQEQEK